MLKESQHDEGWAVCVCVGESDTFQPFYLIMIENSEQKDNWSPSTWWLIPSSSMFDGESEKETFNFGVEKCHKVRIKRRDRREMAARVRSVNTKSAISRFNLRWCCVLGVYSMCPKWQIICIFFHIIDNKRLSLGTWINFTCFSDKCSLWMICRKCRALSSELCQCIRVKSW